MADLLRRVEHIISKILFLDRNAEHLERSFHNFFSSYLSQFDMPLRSDFSETLRQFSTLNAISDLFLQKKVLKLESVMTTLLLRAS